VLFATDHSDLNAKAQSALEKVADEIDEHGSGTVAIDGYTDSVGTDAHNDALSKARANAVLKALESLVTSPDVTFTTAGHGEQDPVADNGTAEGRQLNRRVTVSFATETEQ
jgi:outer membrane protein OmpA-like peptidoglycan-associated protein